METIAKCPVLSDSNKKSRPDTFAFYRSEDTDTFKNEIKKRPRPTISINEWKTRRFAFEETDQDQKNSKWKEAMIQKSKESVTDPLSGCMSQAYDQPRQENKCLIKSYTLKSLDPPHIHPKEFSSTRNDPNAPLTLQGNLERDNRVENQWNTKIVARSATGKMGGWTSEVDPRVTGQVRWGKSQAFPTFGKLSVPDEEKTSEQKATIKYLYTSSTQRAYENIPFDKMLVSKTYPPTQTLESSADPVRQRSFSSCYDSPTKFWKETPEKLPGWDWQQKRYDLYTLPRQHDFCSDRPRGHQIPSYSGFIGSYKPEHLDNPYVIPYEPINCVRTQVPKFSFTSLDNVKLPALNRAEPVGPTTLSPPWATDYMHGIRHKT